MSDIVVFFALLGVLAVAVVVMITARQTLPDYHAGFLNGIVTVAAVWMGVKVWKAMSHVH